jgi:hypothetical protein
LADEEAIAVNDILAELSYSFPDNFTDHLSDHRLQQLMQSYQKYVSDMAARNAMFAFWSSYLDMV